MKLKNIINEVFNTQHTQNYTHKQQGKVHRYTFTDPNIPNSPEYAVYLNIQDNYNDIIYQLTKTIPPYLNIDPQIEEKITENEKPALTKISLEINTTEYARYAPTNLNNQYYVYSTLLQILQDAFNKDNIILILFQGSIPKMDLIYNRMLKQIAKQNPQMTYTPYQENTYIRKDILEKLNDIPEIQDLTKRTTHAHKQRLQDIKTYMRRYI